jgi:cobalt-zinc-cadmium efflux system outer membrane protein
MKYSSHARMGLLTCTLLAGSFQSQATPPDLSVYSDDIVRHAMAATPESQAAHAGYNVITRAWQQWISLGQDSLRQRAELLETLWRSGEMSTTDYLLQLQQTLNTQIAGAGLQGELWRAWVEWLGASNSLEAWLNRNDKSNAS